MSLWDVPCSDQGTEVTAGSGEGAGWLCVCLRANERQVSYEVTVETYIMKRLEYHFTRVTAPAPKRPLIESHSDGSHSISDLCPCPDERLDDEGDASDTADFCKYCP